METDEAAEPSELSMPEEDNMQVCVLWRCVSTPTGPCESEAGHVLGWLWGMCMCVCEHVAVSNENKHGVREHTWESPRRV